MLDVAVRRLQRIVIFAPLVVVTFALAFVFAFGFALGFVEGLVVLQQSRRGVRLAQGCEEGPLGLHQRRLSFHRFCFAGGAVGRVTIAIIVL